MASDNGGMTNLRRLQLTELGLLKLFARICEKHHLRYYLSGGTLLGAVRHKGFIPWDDDADVAMPRPDYEKFLTIVRSELPEGYSFLNYKQDPAYHRYFCRITDTRVKITNDSNTKRLIEDAWLDIQPCDGMPSGALGRKIHFWYWTFWRFLYRASCFEELTNLNRPNRPFYIRAAIRFLKITKFGANLNTFKLMTRIEKGLMKCDFDKCTHFVCFFGQYMTREIFDKKVLGAYAPYEFEDGVFKGPEDADAMLRQFYGDYMTPPSGADKLKHDITNISFEEDGKP